MIVFNILLKIVIIFLFIVNKEYANSKKVIREYNKLIIMEISIIVILLVRFFLLQYPNSTTGSILDVVSRVMSLLVLFKILKMVVYKEY